MTSDVVQVPHSELVYSSREGRECLPLGGIATATTRPRFTRVIPPPPREGATCFLECRRSTDEAPLSGLAPIRSNPKKSQLTMTFFKKTLTPA